MSLSTGKILFISLGALGVSGAGLATANEFSKKTVSGVLNGKIRLLSQSSDLDDVWNKLRDRVENILNTPPGTSNFPKIFLSLKSKNSDQIDIQKLKNTCSKASSYTYSDLFSKDDDLVLNVLDFCSISIGEVLTSGNMFNTGENDKLNPDAEKIKQKLSSLKTSTSDNSDPILGNLEEVKSSQGDESQTWKNLIRWCKVSYGKSFFDKQDILWNRVETYCKKENTLSS